MVKQLYQKCCKFFFRDYTAFFIFYLQSFMGWFRAVFVLFLLLVCQQLTICPLQAQQMPRVRAVIDTLCSPAMFGRGYVRQGDTKAADFIAAEYRQAGLKPFGSNFFQPFQLNVNTFPEAVALRVNRKVLVPGTDFIADPVSGAGIGQASVCFLDSAVFTDPKAQKAFLKEDFSEGVALVYDGKYERQLFGLPPQVVGKVLSARLLVALHNKLTFGVGREQFRLPKLNVLRQAFPRKPRKVRFQVNALLKRFHATQNVIGYVEGTAKPDSFLVISAHYDHLGGMGNVYFPGGNDNASGVAMLLELARYYAENPLPYSVAFMAFGAEEAGLTGSQFYTVYPLFPLPQIKFLVNLDLFATGEEGMTVVNGSVFQRQYQQLVDINSQGNYLPLIKARGRAANSDHYYFSESGVPAFFFYLMGDWPHYHDVQDEPPLPLSHFTSAFELVREFLAAMAPDQKYD